MATKVDPVEATDDEKIEDDARDKGEPAKTPEELAREVDRLSRQLKEANGDAAKRRKRLEEYEKADAERKKAELTEAERKDAEIKELKAGAESLAKTLRDERIRNATEIEAAKLGFHYPDDAYRMLADDIDAIKFDEDDRPDRKSIRVALKKLLESKPLLASQAEADDPRPARRPPLTPPRDRDSRDGDSRGAERQIAEEVASSGRYAARL